MSSISPRSGSAESKLIGDAARADGLSFGFRAHYTDAPGVGFGIAAVQGYRVVVGYTYGTLDSQAAVGKENAFAVAFDAQGAVI